MNFSVTTFRGFSKVSGEMPLTSFFEEIRSIKYVKLIDKITLLVNSGDTDRANAVKKQLPFITITANYKEKRLPESILRYNDVQTVDIDNLTDEQVLTLRPIIEADPYVLGNFLTPKRHGYKLFLYLLTPLAEQLRKSAFSTGEIGYEALELYHAKMYELARKHCEKLTGVPVDTSGKDISRGVFISFDPLAYLNMDLLAKMVIPEVSILSPLPVERKKKTPGRKPLGISMTGDAKVNIDSMEAWEKMEHQKAVNATKRIMRFEKGNRDTFLFTLGNKCYARAINEDAAVLMVKHDYLMQGLDVETPIRNAYRYTDKVDTVENDNREKKKPRMERVVEFLDEHYSIRRNVILDRLEFADYGECAAGTPLRYMPMRNKDFNSIFLSMQLAGIKCFQTVIHSVIDSDYAKLYNPFDEYFGGLPIWNGERDFITELADTLETDDQDFWRESFKRWLVGLVAGALKDEITNHLVLILYSKQGKGKSTWIHNLLPPELKEYYRNGMISPENKDHALFMSTRLLINMEEFEGMKYNDIAGLKRLVTQDVITERKVYGINAEMYVRHASFIGSTNEARFLQDFSGARRFICPVVKKINYKTPVDYKGVYSQAVYLLNNGYQYWYEGDEIENLNERNEKHRMKEPLEEMLYVYYRKAEAKDFEVKWKPAAAIMSTIAMYGRILVNKLAQENLTKVMERDGFKSRVNVHGTTEYEVVQLCMDEVERNFKMVTKKELPKDTVMSL
ncbi:VapE domain-containing protein [uncultured Bacteroides sp.]|uniref:VapE domain-containing protein n=1 Tax=uncultured Bacteroides sp. TaxID=162156 RepID=UPI002AAA704F|nr:VapE domain-containing protein [uncultured Bacteroides sp.]